MNPEFLRNLWLEASPRRLVGLAVVLGLVFGAAALSQYQTPDRVLSVCGPVGLAIYALCGLLWASRAAGGSVLDEVRGRTWDFQRLSALSPWRMTWGKLLGASALAWLGALAGLLAAGVSTTATKGAGDGLTLVAALAAFALFLQACAMGAALVGVRKARAEGRIATSGAVLLGVIGGLFLISLLSNHLPMSNQGWINALTNLLQAPSVIFWGAELPGPQFVAVSLACFAAWASAGAWRLMRLELQMRNSPWLWVAFLLFAGLWRAGLATPDGPAGEAMSAAVVFAVLSYAAAFVEPADALHLRRFAAAVGRGRLLEAADRAPAAVFSFKLAVLAVVAAAVLGWSDHSVPALNAAVAVAFLVRDLGVILLFRLGPRPGRADLSAVVALALLYGVGAVIDHLCQPAGVALFMPFSTVAPAVTLGSGLVQALVAWSLAVRRIRAPAGLGQAAAA